MHRWDPAQLRIDLRDKRTQLQLFGELTRVEIANRAGLNFRRINLRVIDRLFAGFNDDVPDRLAFLLEVALKIGASAAENVNFVHNAPSTYPIFPRCHPERSEGSHMCDCASETPKRLQQRLDMAPYYSR